MLKKISVSFLTLLMAFTQFSPLIDVFAEENAENKDKLKYENKQTGNDDPSTENSDNAEDGSEISADTETSDDSSSNDAAVQSDFDSDSQVEVYASDSLEGSITEMNVSAELFKGASKTNDGYVWTATTNASGHGVAYRVSYSTSGIASMPKDSIHIDMPLHIMKDSDGNYADTYDISLPTEEEFEEAHQNDGDTIFTYKELDTDNDGENDTIRVYNAMECTSGQNGYYELAYYTSKPTMSYTDMSKSDPFKATLSIGSKNKSTDEIPFIMDTSVSITGLTTYTPTKYTSWQDDWGTELKPSNASDYLYLVYQLKSTVEVNSSQIYNFSIDSKPTSKTGDVEIVGYKFSGAGKYQAENYINNQTMTGGRWDYVLVKFNKKTFEDAGSYTIKNDVTTTVTPYWGIDKPSSKKGTPTYSWVKPIFKALAGSFDVFEHGNGTWDTTTDNNNSFYWDKQNKDYTSSRGRDYENYSLDELQDGSVSSLDDIRFISHSVSYNGSWTIEKGKDSSNPDNYYKKNVTSSLESGIKYLEDFKNDLVPSDDYNFTSSQLTSDDFNINYFTYEITNEYRTINPDNLKFEIPVSGKNFENDTVYTFYAKYGKTDSWVKSGTYTPSTGAQVISDTAHIQSITNDTVTFKKGSNAVAYKVETSAASYKTSIYCEEFISLKNSSNVLSKIKGKQIAYIANVDTLHTYDYNNKELYNETAWDFVRLIRSQRDSEITKKAVSGTNNVKKKQYLVTWRIAMNETITRGSGDGVKEYIEQNGGTYYDLLPEGAIYSDASIYITDENGNEISSSNYTVQTKDNYKKSNRTLLTISITQPAKQYIVYFDTTHSWNNIKDYGSDVVNPVAYETGNKSISKGYYDDPTKPSDNESGNAFSDSKLNTYLTGLDSTKSEKAKFIYTEGKYDILAITAGATGLTKKVFGDNASDYTYSAQTHVGGEYSYKVRMQNTYTTKASNLIYFDSLENYVTPEGKKSDWHGTLTGVGLNQLVEAGINPVVYISTVENLNLSNHHDLNDTSVWHQVSSDSDLSSAKAIAIDARTKKDGSIFVLNPGESVTFYLYMVAPTSGFGKNNGYPYAYNNIYLNDTVTTTTGVENYFIHQDYTKIYCLITGDLNIRKVSAINPDQAVSGIKYRLYGTSDYGNNIDMIQETGSDGSLTFKNVEMGNYILQEYDCGDDWLIDSTEYNVTIDSTGATSVSNGDYSTGVLTLSDSPRIHVDISFNKKEYNSNKSITGAKFLLSGVSDYGNRVTKYATSVAGKVSFANIEKGTYTLTEATVAPSYIKDGNKYTVVIDDGANVSISLASGVSEFFEISNKGKAIIYNEPLHSFTILKQNSYDYSAVNGVTFKLSGTSDYGTSVDIEATTANGGMATFNGLESGTYVLKETKVEEQTSGVNVELDTTPHAIVIDKLGNATIDGMNKDSQGNTIIVDTAKSDKTVTVIKKFVDQTPKDHSKDLPTLHISTNDPNATDEESLLDESGESKPIFQTITDGIVDTFNSIKGLFVTDVQAEESADWYKDWTYTLNDTNKTIQITQYNGDKTDYVIPSKATINGITYTTYLKSGKLNYNAGLKTGNIQNLSFAKGIRLDSSLTALFYKDSSLVTVDMNNLDTSKVTKMYSMFSNCSSLTSLDLSSFNTSKVTDMYSMFSNCSSLTNLDLSSFDTSKVTYMSSMFSNCSSLTSLDLSSFDTSNVTDMNSMFSDCASLTNLNLSSFDTSKVTYMNSMFSNCSSLTNLNLSSFDTSNVTDMNSMFSDCASLTNLNLSSFDTSKVTEMYFMFFKCSSLTNLDLSSFDTSNGTHMDSMFSNCSSLTSLDLSGFDTSKVTEMYSMFSNCSSLTNLDLSSFDTSNVIHMDSMFSNCSSLTSLDLSSFNTSKVTEMYSMFFNCSSLTSLDLSGFDTSKVTKMYSMFSNCSSLTNLDLSSFDTSNVTHMYSMFSNCSSLTSLDLSSFNTSKVTEMYSMFSNCSSLTSLDLSGFDTSKVTSMRNMFSGCSILNTISMFFPTSKFNLTTLLPQLTNSLKVIQNIKLKPGIPSANFGSLVNGSTKSPYTGNWTAFSEYNHANGSDLTPDMYDKYSSLQNAYASITDEQWAANPDGIWFMWEKEGQDPANQNYTSKTANFYTPEYDSNGKVKMTPEKQFTKDGYWQKLDESTYSYTFYVVDSDRPFYVWEDVMDGYESSNLSTNPIKINNGSETATITNTSNEVTSDKTGSLMISKSVKSTQTLNAKISTSFSFTVTLTDADNKVLTGNKMYGNVAFKNGVAKISLKDRESLTIPDIPNGYHYSVVETPVTGYTSTSTNSEGEIIKGQTVNAQFTNYLEKETPGKYEDETTTKSGIYTLTKNVTGYNADKDTTKFEFTVLVTGLLAKADYPYKTVSADGTESNAQYYTADDDGNAIIDVKLGNKESIKMTQLPDAATVTATEAASAYIASYEVSNTAGVVTNASGSNSEKNEELSTDAEVITAGSTTAVTFTNKNDIKKSITVSKEVTGKDDNDTSFEFTIDFSGLTPNSILSTDTIGRITADDDGDATKSFFLKNGESIVISNIPAGASYTVAESGTPNYKASYEINTGAKSYTGEGDIAKETASKKVTINSDDSDHTVKFTNVYSKTYTLTVSKEVKGNLGDRTKSFNFVTQMPASLYGQTLNAIGSDGNPTLIKISSTGRASFTLKNGESLVFEGITEAEATALKKVTNYGISEEDYSADGYKTTINASTDSDGNLLVKVTNLKATGIPTGNHISTGIMVAALIACIGVAYTLSRRLHKN